MLVLEKVWRAAARGKAGGHAPDELVAARPVLSHWHASRAKNSSHIFATLECQIFVWDLDTLVLLNLDCDQIFEGSYVAALQKNFSTRMRPEIIPVSLPVRVRCGSGGSLTGRIAYSCSTFLAIGGYDEEEGVLGSGYQAVDITPPPLSRGAAPRRSRAAL